jgi:hypothetical protein
VVSTTSRPLYPRGNTRYPLYRRLGGPQERSGRVRKISPKPGFDPRTVQPRSQSLYRLSYRAHNEHTSYIKIYFVKVKTALLTELCYVSSHLLPLAPSPLCDNTNRYGRRMRRWLGSVLYPGVWLALMYPNCTINHSICPTYTSIYPPQLSTHRPALPFPYDPSP